MKPGVMFMYYFMAHGYRYTLPALHPTSASVSFT